MYKRKRFKNNQKNRKKYGFKKFGSRNQKLQINLQKKKYSIPTPIQDQAIKLISEKRDLIGLANTGTGKTAAFLLPLIERAYQSKYEKVLIITPTRELAAQIDKEFRDFSGGMNLYSTTCIGGNPIRRQISSLRRNPNFVIGTPGRLKDLSNRKLLKFNSFQNIILDEVEISLKILLKLKINLKNLADLKIY